MTIIYGISVQMLKISQVNAEKRNSISPTKQPYTIMYYKFNALLTRRSWIFDMFQSDNTFPFLAIKSKIERATYS